ncbi:Coiled-coil domain-containing protein SCD2 [Vitis vinifera]|uniref:Coiled-coil domain-containing protein SCD2 n=1 Tax=Vitis vinifera TaxID=29760 RepID=A0A438EXZ8_VITVI|nr:Coiled-coil domain-containing protein SCD2 [Vitis vinifera]
MGGSGVEGRVARGRLLRRCRRRTLTRVWRRGPVECPPSRESKCCGKSCGTASAQVMASQTADDDDDDDDLGFRYSAPPPPAPSSYASSINSNHSISSARATRSPSPAVSRNFVEHTPSVRSTSAGRPAMSVRAMPIVPSSRATLRNPVSIPPMEPPAKNRPREKRSTLDLGHINLKGAENQHEASALMMSFDLQKKGVKKQRLDLGSLRNRCIPRSKVVEQEGSSIASKRDFKTFLATGCSKGGKTNQGWRDEEIANLRLEIQSFMPDPACLNQNLKDGATTAIEQLQEAESEAKALRSMTKRMILTQEEMEEVVLKRCWLARYWGLAVRHAICADIALSKHEHWSSLAPLPFEVVISAGQKAKEESWNGGGEDPDRSKLVRDLSDLTGEGNIESMLSVEMGLRELASLKVEDAIVLALPCTDVQIWFDSTAQINHRVIPSPWSHLAWLTYFWRRAKVHGVEEDIAEERLQFWISRSGQTPTSHDAVDVERGLRELRKLGIEQQLWEASRKENDQPSYASIVNHKPSYVSIVNRKPVAESDYSP